MIRVYFDAKSWFHSEDRVAQWFNKYTPNNSGCWNKLQLTTSLEESDVVICFNNNVKKFNDKKFVIQVRREPDLIESFNKSKFSNAIIDYTDYYHASTWFVNKGFDSLDHLSPAYTPHKKTENCSAIFSSKYNSRNKLMNAISSHKKCGVHFYGRGIKGIISNSNQYFGELNNDGLCKYLGLASYKKSIAIENSSQKNYFTEKLIDCFVCDTIPIYWGCPNIFDFFPEKSIRKIGEKDSIDEIIDKINRPIANDELDALKVAKYLVMHKYNLWPTIEDSIWKSGFKGR